MDFPRCGSGEEAPSVSGILDDRLCPNPFSDAGGRWIGKITGGRTHASAGQIVWACHRHRADHRGRARCDAMARRCGWVLAMPSANGGVVMSQHAPHSRCDGLNAPRIENATGIGNCHRESDSAVDPLGPSSVYPAGVWAPTGRRPGRTRPGNSTDAVSYTHLTLPTIYSV